MFERENLWEESEGPLILGLMGERRALAACTLALPLPKTRRRVHIKPTGMDLGPQRLLLWQPVE